MAIPVLTYIPSMGCTHRLVRTMIRNEYEDGYADYNDDAETSFSRSDGAKLVQSYKGLNNFVIGYDSAKKGTDQLADNLWTFFLTRLDNHNEPFYFYNPTECDPPDPTGQEARGRYYVKLRYPNQALTREYFRNCLYSYKLEFIECKEFEAGPAEIFEIPIELIDHPMSAYGGGWALQRKTLFLYNPNHYDAVIDIQIEVVATNPGASYDLVIIGGLPAQECGRITIPAGCDNCWLRTNFGGTEGTEFTPIPGGANQYALRMDTTNINCEISTARLIIRQGAGLTKTRIQYPLLQGSETSAGWSGILPLINQIETDDGHGEWLATTSNRSYFKWIPSRFDADNITFQLEMNSGQFNYGSFEGGLFRTDIGTDPLAATPSTLVLGSYIYFNIPSEGWIISDAYTYVATSGSFAPEDLIENVVYEFRWADDRGALLWFGAILHKACLYITLTGVRNFEVYWRVSKHGRNSRMRVNKTTFVHEACSNFYNCPLALIDDGNNFAGGYAGDVLPGSTLTYSVNAKVTRRSGSLSAEQGNYIMPQITGCPVTNQLVVTQFVDT